MVREDSLQENRLLSFFGLLALRICLGIAILLFIDQIAEFETSALLLSFFLIAGVVAGGYFARYRASVIAVAMMHVLLWLLLSSVLWSWDALFVSVNSPAADDFLIYRLSSHLQLTALVYVAGLISTWTYWAKQWTDTVEAVLSCVLFIGLLAGHRNYQLDAPKQLSDLAWQLNLAPQHLILGLGAGYLLILGVYLLFSYTRPVFNSSRVERSRGKSSKVFGVLVPTILCGLIVLLAVYIDRLYSSEIDRVSEGVGMGGQTEGESPLGFHSALGQSRQPAALVRLENDFTTNPWSPMIYFREGVLSRFNGKEIVAGPTTLDADVPRISPGQPYIVVESELVPGRKEVQQSIFLLTEHKNPFDLTPRIKQHPLRQC